MCFPADVTIAELLVLKRQSYVVRRSFDLSFKEFVDGFFLAIRCGGVIPFDKLLIYLAVGEYRQQANVLIGTCCNSLQQYLKMANHSIDCFRIEESPINKSSTHPP